MKNDMIIGGYCSIHHQKQPCGECMDIRSEAVMKDMQKALIKKRFCFDIMKFFYAIDVCRATHKMQWKDVAEASGVDAATLTRLKDGKHPNADNIAALFAWSNLDFASFILPVINQIEGGK